MHAAQITIIRTYLAGSTLGAVYTVDGTRCSTLLSAALVGCSRSVIETAIRLTVSESDSILRRAKLVAIVAERRVWTDGEYRGRVWSKGRHVRLYIREDRGRGRWRDAGYVDCVAHVRGDQRSADQSKGYSYEIAMGIDY